MFITESGDPKTLFLKCPFAKNCWLQIGVLVLTWLRLERATIYIKKTLSVPFAMEIIMNMSWCIWEKGIHGFSMMNTLM
jgi:hypothetical protein